MKIFLFPVVFVVLLVLVSADKEEKRCNTAEDCDEATECCLHLGIFRKGICHPRAKENESCSAEEDKLHIWGEKYLLHCPCLEGMDCTPEKVKDFGIFGQIKINERCIVGGSTGTSEVVEATTMLE